VVSLVIRVLSGNILIDTMTRKLTRYDYIASNYRQD
jgi:hypothetical protein